jgi:hypothetical protein
MVVQKLQNDKCAHHLVEGFLAVPKVEQGHMVWEGYGLVTYKQTNKHLS